MKKTNFIISIAYIFIMLSLICFPVSASEVGTYFDATENSLIISGNIGSSEMTPVTVHISEYSVASSAQPPVFSKQNTPLASELLFTGDNGALSATIPLSKAFKNNKYTVHFYSTEDNGSGFYSSIHFVCFNPESTEALEAVTRINDASKIDFTAYKNAIITNGMSLGIDLSEYAEHFDYASDITFSLISKMDGQKYTPVTFRDNFFSSVAASMIKNNQNVNGAISNYFANFGTTYDEYSLLPSDVKETLDSLLISADYKKAVLSDIYNEMLSVTNVRTEKNLEEFIKKVTENDVFGISVNDVTYQKISPAYRNLVFNDMFAEKDTYTSALDVLNSFNKNTASILRLHPQNTPNPPSPSIPSGSSSSSTVVSGGTNILIPSDTPDDVDKEEQAVFNDTKNHWSTESINYLVSLKAINGYPDGSFKPDDNVTRAEFAKIVCNTFGISGSYKEIFSDVSENDWFAQSVCALSDLNIVNGYSSEFSPNSNIKREDAAVILFRLLDYLNINTSGSKLHFGDTDFISDYALASVEKMSEAGIITGDDNLMFNPLNNLTRAEACAIIHRTHMLGKGGMTKWKK